MSEHEKSENETLIRLKDLRKAYRTPAGDFYALKGIELTVHAGEFLAILGKSGAGKSTLVNMITGIDRPTEGEIWVGDKAIQSMSEDQVTTWRGRTLGVVFQFFQLLPMLTCAQNVMMPMDFAGLYGGTRQRRERALHLLERVGIAEHADKLPSAVSGGQRQRVAIARALANDPALLVADEPTGNLDSKTTATMFELFSSLMDEGKTVVLVTHDRDLAAHGNATRAHCRRPDRGSSGWSTTMIESPVVSGLQSAGPWTTMIDLRGLTKVYQTPVGPFPALRGIDLQVATGEFIAVVGKSGSGKSTLINMFTGIDHPTDGEIVVAGRRVRELNEGQMAEWRGRTMGIVFQFFQLLPTLTIAENVMLPMDLARLYSSSERYDRAFHLLEQVGLAEDGNKFPATVSGGQQQRGDRACARQRPRDRRCR